MIGKLVLGTAGLGGDSYGRFSTSVGSDPAIDIMLAAFRAGIRTVDTAPTYGSAEHRVGFACNHCGEKIHVITKTTGDKNEAARSLKRLNGAASVEFFWHNYDPPKDSRQYLPSWVTGATVYGNEGASRCWGVTKKVQVDWNILRQTEFGKFGYLPKMGGETIFARSVFLQGVLAGACPPDDRMAPLIERAENVASYYGVNLPTFALRAALEHHWIDYVVIGPQSRRNLDDIIEIANRRKLDIAPEHLHILDEPSAEYLDPRKWAA